MIHYIKSNLFDILNNLDTHKKYYIIHSCNCMAKWGAGFALKLKQLFPESYEIYKQSCNSDKIGSALIISTKYDNVFIVCLFVSNKYGYLKDEPTKILLNTQISINDMMTKIDLQNAILCSPKINSGLFNVPWIETEELITKNIIIKNIDWFVYVL